jgi:acyl-CoA dehydrogenase
MWQVLIVVVLAVALLFAVPGLRRRLIAAPVMGVLRPFLPRMGDTERIALDAGTVWWDGELFSGKPDWQKLFDFKPRPLSDREQAFLDGPVDRLCRMIDDWQITQDRRIPQPVWDYLKSERFFGMIIPEEYGGLGFSAIGHSAVIVKVASRSISVACTLMVPNSLGPAELLLHYGTDTQRRHYLPRLAAGDEVPCFALTEPYAGSDAASGRSSGIVCRGTFDGREVLGVRLDFDKRYITLAPVATLIGLAFSLHDPDGLLGGERYLGITCVLLPRDTPGIRIGEQHDPLGVPFPNGPVTGKDVFVPIDFIIGGQTGIGQGWRMLMECLAAGRSISLPALSVAAAEIAVRLTGAYASFREQFGTPIGRFEGVEEALTRIAGNAYLMNAVRTLTCGAVDAGEKPAVLSGIAKTYLTEAMRGSVNDAMDVLAGRGICRGPRNPLARIYAAVPIGITVEGANILTRSLIVFGQGALRCHPHLREEMAAIADGDLIRFDRVLFRHLRFFAGNLSRAFLGALGPGRLNNPPPQPALVPYLRRMSRMSAAFALATDVTLATLGGTFKRREKLSGRLADALAWMYLGSAVLKRFHENGRQDADLPLAAWTSQLALFRIQEALVGVCENLPKRWAGRLLRVVIFPLGARLRPPSDVLGGAVAQAMLDGGEVWHRLTGDIFLPDQGETGLGSFEKAVCSAVAAKPAARKIRDGVARGLVEAEPAGTLADRAMRKGLIGREESDHLVAAAGAIGAAIEVDAYPAESYASLKG